MKEIGFQYDMFETKREREMRMKLEAIKVLAEASKASSDRVRKKLFASNGALTTRLEEVENRLNILERNICLGVNDDRNIDLSCHACELHAG